MSTSPMILSLKHLRAQGATVAIVEHWNHVTRRRQDLFGIFDILALLDGDTIAIQTTSTANIAARTHKIADSPHLPAIRAAGWTILIHGWAKKQGRWVLREIDVS